MVAMGSSSLPLLVLLPLIYLVLPSPLCVGDDGDDALHVDDGAGAGRVLDDP
jgi:hypothetical protein